MWQIPQDRKEEIRLKLVGLAAEIATVADCAERELAPPGLCHETDEMRARCKAYLRAARRVLSTRSRLHYLCERDLLTTLNRFKDMQRKVVILRSESEFLSS